MRKHYTIINFLIHSRLVVYLNVMKLFFMVVWFFIPCLASAENSIKLPKLSGELKIEGDLVLSACSLDFSSKYQDVDLGVIERYHLKNFGAQSPSVFFEIKILRCDFSRKTMIERNSGNIYFDRLQPVVNIKFIGQSYQDNFQLIKLNGVTGVGLRLYDSKDRSITLGEVTRPQFIGETYNRLQYRVLLERTLDELTTGSYSANINFLLSYE